MTPRATAVATDHRWETRLFGIVAAFLTVFGIAAVYSAASFQDEALIEVLKQLSGAMLGMLALMIASRLDYRKWREWAWGMLLIVFGMLLFVLLARFVGLGSLTPEANGARRWIRIPGFTFQPSEIARFVIVVWTAAIAAKKGEQLRDFKKGVVPLLVIIGAVAGLIMIEPNLSMAIVVGSLGAVVLFTAGAKIGQFLLVTLAAIGAGIGAIVLTDFRWARVACHLGMADGCDQGKLYQVQQASVGFASGGLFGVGFGEGRLKLDYLTYAPSDFLFSTVGEEWGFLGTLSIIVLFGIFCWLGFRIARTTTDPFGKYLATGLTASVGLSAMMHMAVNVGLMPTTGLTLPFMSAGRSNLMVTLLAVGVIISVGRARSRARTR